MNSVDSSLTPSEYKAAQSSSIEIPHPGNTRKDKSSKRWGKNETRKKLKSGKTVKKATLCDVCNQFDGKYRFKCCQMRFCSVKCYAEHPQCGSDIATNAKQNADSSKSENGIDGGEKLPSNSNGCLPQSSKSNKSETVNNSSEVGVRDGAMAGQKRIPNRFGHLTKKQEKLLSEDATLLEYFRNDKLRKVIVQIVKAEKPLQELSYHLNEPYFLRFIEDITSLVDRSNEEAKCS